MNKAHDAFIEKADMPQEEEPVASCDICGKDLFDAETGIAVTTGEIVEQDGGFMSDDCAWLYVACKECGAKITDAVEKIIDNIEKEAK